jgi:hypothetical protein
MKPDQLMCAQGVCVTEEDLYRERGPMIYSIEDQLYYQKYEMAKSLILQKIIEKKLAGTGQTFADYHRKISNEIKTSDDDVRKLLKDMKITEVTDGTPQFLELKEKMNGDKVMAHYRKVFNDYKGKKEITNHIGKRARQSVKPQFENMVSYKTTKDDDLKVTMVINPTRFEQLSFLDSAESISKHMSGLGKKISWYFLPYTDGQEAQLKYEKLFLCSFKIDGGKSYRELTSVEKLMESNEKIFAFLKKRKQKTEPLQACLNSKDTQNKISKMKDFVKNSNLLPIPQIIFNNEVEYRIPGMMELKNRVELKLKIKALVKRDSTRA